MNQSIKQSIYLGSFIQWTQWTPMVMFKGKSSGCFRQGIFGGLGIVLESFFT